MNMNLRELYLADNKLNGLQDSAQLGNLLKFNCSLQILDLRNNHVLDSGAHEAQPPLQAPSTHQCSVVSRASSGRELRRGRAGRQDPRVRVHLVWGSGRPGGGDSSVETCRMKRVEQIIKIMTV